MACGTRDLNRTLLEVDLRSEINRIPKAATFSERASLGPSGLSLTSDTWNARPTTSVATSSALQSYSTAHKWEDIREILNQCTSCIDQLSLMPRVTIQPPVYIHIYIYICVYEYRTRRIHIHVHIRSHTRTHSPTCLVYIHVHLHVCIIRHTYTYTYAYTYTCTSTYTQYTHT